MKTYFRDLKTEFNGYNGKKLMQDIMAGLTVAAVALPLALAFGVSSGATAAAGLLTAIIAGFVISLFGGAFYQISGPTGAMAAILMSIIAQYGMKGVFIATIMAGIILILAGVLKLGRLTAFIPMPVIAGFTSGIAVIIALGQLDNFFGVTSVGDTAIEKFLSYFKNGFSPDLTTIIIGLAVIIFMILFPKKWNSIVPASLVAIILATAVSALFSLQVSTVGAIPSSLLLEERFSFAGLNFAKVKGLIGPAVSIAALGMVESLLCGASASRMTGVRLNSNRELIAQGLGNILSPIFGGIPATAAIARTIVAIKSGARTRLTGMIHAVVLLISMLALGPVMSRIPLSALAGVLLVTSWRMNEWSTIKYIFSHKFKGGILKFLATMVATIVFDLTVAILIGVIIGLVLLVARLSKLSITYNDCGESNDEVRISVSGNMIFANTEQVSDILDNLNGKNKVVFDFSNVASIDISAAYTFLEMVEQLKSREVIVSAQNMTPSVKKMLDRGEITELLEIK